MELEESADRERHTPSTYVIEKAYIVVRCSKCASKPEIMACQRSRMLEWSCSGTQSKSKATRRSGIYCDQAKARAA